MASFILAIAGILLAYFFYKKSQRTREPRWGIRNSNLIAGYGAKLSRLRVIYDDHDVDNLSVSKVLIWNDGREPIRSGDVSKVNTLRIVSSPGVIIYESRLITASSPSCQVSVAGPSTVSPEHDGTEAYSETYINFDYLSHNQGLIVQVVHSGTSAIDLSVAGEIIDAKIKRQRVYTGSNYLMLPTPTKFDRSLSPARRRVINIGTSIAMALTMFGLALFLVYQGENDRQILSNPSWSNTTLSILLLIQPVILILLTYIRYSRRYPADLDSFTADDFG